MTAYHATHESPFDDACPDCAGYGDPEPADRIGPFLQVGGWLIVIVALAVIVRLAVSR